MKNNLRVERAILDVSMEEVAKAVKVARQTIHQIENNKYSPSLLLAFRIAKYFNKPVTEIFKPELKDVEDVESKEAPEEF